MAARTGDKADTLVLLIIAIITLFIGAFAFTTINVALPTIGREFAAAAVLLGWMSNAITLAQAAIVLAAGRLADIYERKKVFILGIIITLIPSFLCVFARSSIWLIVCLMIIGIGVGITIAPLMAILNSAFPPERRGWAMGVAVASASFGAAAGPFLGGVLTQYLGWRIIFLLLGILNLIVLVLSLWKLKETRAEAGIEKFDVAGAILLAISVVLLMYGFTALPDIHGIIYLLIGVIGILIFLRIEAKIANPIFNTKLFRHNPVFSLSILATIISCVPLGAISFFLSLYLQYLKGFPPQTAGLILCIQSVITALLAPIVGRTADKFGYRIVASIGMTLLFLSLLFFIFIDEGTALGIIIIGLFIFGLGGGFFNSPNMNAIFGSVGAKNYGIASGLHTTARMMGTLAGMAIAMISLSLYLGKAAIIPETYSAFLASTKAGFIIFSLICLVGSAVQLVIMRKPEVSLPIKET